MSRRAWVCVLRGERDEIDLATVNCSNQSHYHIRRDEAIALEKNGEVEWLKEPANRKEKGIVRVLKQNFSIRGLSCKVGTILASAVRAKETWALVMLGDIRRKVQPPAEKQAA
jgi:hypothetical protein